MDTEKGLIWKSGRLFEPQATDRFVFANFSIPSRVGQKLPLRADKELKIKLRNWITVHSPIDKERCADRTDMPSEFGEYQDIGATWKGSFGRVHVRDQRGRGCPTCP